MWEDMGDATTWDPALGNEAGHSHGGHKGGEH